MTRRIVDVRFTFREEVDGLESDETLVELVGIERVKCELTEDQQLQVGEDWAQSDRYSIGISMDIIGVVSDGDKADYSEKGPRTW